MPVPRLDIGCGWKTVHVLDARVACISGLVAEMQTGHDPDWMNESKS